jgi:hypothetical protein
MFYGIHPSDIALGIIEFEKAKGFSLPKIFPIPLHSDLSDKKKAPNFNRVGITSAEVTNGTIRLMKLYKW